jgi:hypothetical protein
MFVAVGRAEAADEPEMERPPGGLKPAIGQRVPGYPR